MRKLFGLLVYIFCFAAPAMIVEYYDMFIDPMSPEDKRLAIIGGTLGMIFLNLIITMAGGNRNAVPKTPTVKAPKKTGKTPKAVLVKKPSAPKERIVTDPATKAQRRFTWNDKDGVWESDDGQTILDTDGLDKWEKQRVSDHDWADKQMEKLKNRDTDFDRDMAKRKKDAEKELARMEKEQKNREQFAKHYGKYEMTEEEMKKFLDEEASKNTLNSFEQQEIGNEYDRVTNYLEWVQWTADLGVDVLDILTLGAGKPIKNAYIYSRNTAGDLMDCLINKKNPIKQGLKSVTKTTIDLIQNNVNKIGYKYAANGIGDGIKGGLDAAEKGEDVLKGTIKGTLQGTARTGIEHGLSKVKLPKSANAQKIAKDTSKRSLEILGHQQSGLITSKTANALRNTIKTKGALQIAADTNMRKDLLSTGLGKLSDGGINKLFGG